MANLTLKKLSEQSYTTAAHKAGAAAENIKLKELAGAQLLPYVVDKSLFMELTKNNPILSADATGLKVTKNQASQFVDKTGVGAGSAKKWRVAKPINIEWHTPLVAFEAYTAVEKNQADKAISTAAKIEGLLVQFQRKFERTSFAKLEDKVTSDNTRTSKNLLSATPQDAWKTLVNKATELTTLELPEQGIDLIAAEDILILVKPTLLDHIVQAGFAGDRTDISFTNGQYQVAHIGGYKVVTVPFLSKYDAIVTTNFVATAAEQIIALTAGKIDTMSEDEGVYFEAMFASEIIWDKLSHGFYSTSTAPTKPSTPELVETNIPTTKLQD